MLEFLFPIHFSMSLSIKVTEAKDFCVMIVGVVRT